MAVPYENIAHLLRRTGFGGTQAEINALTGLTLDQAVDKVLDTSVNPAVVDPVLNQTATTNYWLERMRTVKAPIQEKMTLFWHGHFVSGLPSVEQYYMLWDQNKLYRTMAMGSIYDLAQKMSIDQAMLRYLNNDQNFKGSPNENFARELMELFTLGVNEYTQNDIVEVARAWTGHGLKLTYQDPDNFGRNKYQYFFDATRHDTGNKTIFGITKNWDGPDVVKEIFQGVKKNTAAKFLATELWEFFAYTSPEPAVLTVLTNSLLSTNFNTKAMLRVMFLRSEFYTTKAKQGLLRTPVEFGVAALKYTDFKPEDTGVMNYLPAMGQTLFAPPNVAGWPRNEGWIGTTAFWKRAAFARNLAARSVAKGLMAGTGTVSSTTAVQKALDTFGINNATAATKADMIKAIDTERAANGTNEALNLIIMALLSPEFALA